MATVVVRLSRGRFDAGQFEVVEKKMAESRVALEPAIRALRGCLHYWVGIDRVSNTIVNISVWQSLADARQMETLAPMLALAAEFVQLGVTFERPICNYETLWEL